MSTQTMNARFIGLSPVLVAGLVITAAVLTAAATAAIQPAFSQTNTNNQLIIIPQGAAIEGAVTDYYIPETAQIPVDSQVTWQNQDTAAHTATAGTPTGGATGQFDTGIIAPGGSATVAITTRGLIPYFCTLHPWMTGTLQVSPSEISVLEGQQQQQPLQQNVTATNATATNATATNATATNATATNATGITTGNQTATSNQTGTASTTAGNNTAGITGG